MNNKVNFKFKGKRDYIHGTDIFRNFINHININFNLNRITNFDMQIKKKTNFNQLILSKMNDEKIILNSTCEFFYEDIKIKLFMIDSKNIVNEFYDYDENLFENYILKKREHELNLRFNDNSNKIDHLIDSNKYLLTKIFNYNKWLFTGLKIYDGKFKNFWNCKNIKIKFSNSISNIFVKTILLINDVEVGEIFFYKN